jgi:L-lactate dehydrogenase (cytochrome)
MVDVTHVDTSTTLAGCPSSLPFFIAPTGMAKLSHPRGEQCFAEGTGLEGIPFTVRAAPNSNPSGCLSISPAFFLSFLSLF